MFYDKHIFLLDVSNLILTLRTFLLVRGRTKHRFTINAATTLRTRYVFPKCRTRDLSLASALEVCYLLTLMFCHSYSDIAENI